MSLNRRLWTRGGVACLLAVGVAAASGPLVADGGVTFTNVSPAAGITYQRFGTPVREADANSFLNHPLPLPIGFDVLAQTPQKPRGAPGLILFDYDNDNDLDIYVTNGPGHANSLYRNSFSQTGVVSFTDVAAAAGVAAPAQDSSAVCFGDIDNDGDEDFYLTNVYRPNFLYVNNGNGTFTNVGQSAGVGGGTLSHSGCAMADFNGDGYLDILVGNTYSSWATNRRVVFLPGFFDVEPNQLFYRLPGLPGIKFADVSTTSGIRDLGPYGNLNGASYTWAVAAVDYDQDGDVDIMWADTNGPPPAVRPDDDRGYNRLLQNNGSGHFTDVTAAAHLDVIGSWMGLSYGDYNCDGHIDFFSTNLGSYVGGLLNSTRWFLSDGAGGFTDPLVESFLVGPPLTIQGTAFGWGTSTVDYDNDGDQDIIWYGDDDLLTAIAMDNPGSLLQNHGCNADFSYDFAAFTTDHRRREVNGVATGDFDNDNFQDMATVAMFRIVPQQGRFLPFTLLTGPTDPVLDTLAAFENVFRAAGPGFAQYVPHSLPNGDLAVEINSGGNGNGGVNFETLGSFGITERGEVNRDGIGAVLKFTPDGGKTVIMPLVGGGSHASQDSRFLHFGLGSASHGTVQVTWPGGVTNVLFNVAAGERVLLPEVPCDYNRSSWPNFDAFNNCLVKSLNSLLKARAITPAERNRIRENARQAFADGF